MSHILKALKTLLSQAVYSRVVLKAPVWTHQAPRAWYGKEFSVFLLQHIQKRVDIIFGSTNKAWCDEFEVLMKGEFKMSAMGEMTFFLGLQVKQLPDGIFISQDKYVKDMLTKFKNMESINDWHTYSRRFSVSKKGNQNSVCDTLKISLQFGSLRDSDYAVCKKRQLWPTLLQKPSILLLLAAKPEMFIFQLWALSRYQLADPLSSADYVFSVMFSFLRQR
ncbi:putative ribonuclease H-like domain-containing protein [Tanacetum coccineum]